jgi:hypothetical protein
VLTSGKVHSILKSFFPSRNDGFPSDYVEELQELADFRITTEEQLEDLLRKRVGQIMEIDRSPMDNFHVRFYSRELGVDFVANRVREGFWFSYPALLRIALELEFGESYQRYAEKRDGIFEPDVSPAPSLDES